MMNENQLLALGYEVNEDPDQSGWFYWKNDTEGSEISISFDSKEAAIWEASQDAFGNHRELSQCDNCGAVHESDELDDARHLAERVWPGFIVASRNTAPYEAAGVSVVNPWNA